MSKPIKAIRISIATLDENDTLIERDGARYDLVDPGEYDIDFLAGTVSDTAAAAVRALLGEGQG